MQRQLFHLAKFMFPRQTTTPHLYSWVTALLKLNNTVQCIRGMMGGGGGWGGKGVKENLVSSAGLIM